MLFVCCLFVCLFICSLLLCFYYIRAAGSPIWKCRVLASDAFLPTLSVSNLHNVLTVLSDSLSIQQQNKTHGILLMILSILNHSSPTGKTGEIVLSITSETLNTLFTILMKKFTIGLRYIHACTCTTYVTIIIYMYSLCTCMYYVTCIVFLLCICVC